MTKRPLLTYSLLAALWLALLAILYGPLLRSDPLLGRDDIDLIMPLGQVHSVGDYISGVAGGKIFDVAPVRDLTFKLNLMARGIPVLGNFHFWNCVIWSLCVFVLFLLLRAMGRSLPASCAPILLLACHPAMVNTVAWVSARKHLLAGLFVLLASAAVVTGRPRRYRLPWIALCYLLALLSQPIVLLWPLWWLLCERIVLGKTWGRSSRTVAPLLPLLLAAAALNSWYYSGPYLHATSGFTKFVSTQLAFDPRFTALSLGRHFWQLLVPLRVSPLEYDVDSLLNSFGMFLLAAVLLAGARCRLRKEVMLWLSPFFLALAVVVARPTFVFVSDTYLVWPILALAVLLARLLDECSAAKWISGALLVVVVPALMVLSLPLSRSWLSTDAAVAYAYRVEPSEKVMYLRTVALLRDRDWNGALEVAYRNLDNRTIGRGVFAEVVLEHPGIPLGEKEKLLLRYYAPSLSYVYRLAAVYAQQGKFERAFSALLPFGPGLGSRDPYALPDFNDQGVIGAELLFFCRKSGKPAAECDKVDANLRKQFTASGTSDLATFDARSKALANPRK